MTNLMLLNMLGSDPGFQRLLLLVSAGLALLVFAVTRNALRALITAAVVGTVLYVLSAGVIVDYVREDSQAIGAVRSVISSEDAYSQANEGAFGRLSCLAVPASCGWPAGVPTFADTETAALKPRRGYSYYFVPGAPKAGPIDHNGLASFAYLAVPTQPGEGSRRVFCGDHTGRVCFTEDGTLPVRNGRCSETCKEIPR